MLESLLEFDWVVCWVAMKRLKYGDKTEKYQLKPGFIVAIFCAGLLDGGPGHLESSGKFHRCPLPLVWLMDGRVNRIKCIQSPLKRFEHNTH